MTNALPVDDSLLTTAFSLHANPGAYALLLGAGVSAPSGIPTAWGVLTELVQRLSVIAQDNSEAPGPDAAHTWYEERYGKPATYESVLEQIAPTPHERQRLLRDFFERSPEDVDTERKLPTLAHRAIARLVRAGVIKVIVTLNFDRLIEQALRDEGIEPTTIASSADVAGMAPLHTLDCCVIHLHGDYLNPTSMLNTTDELHGYAPRVEGLLHRILQDYGLIIAGWSSTYDPALRASIAEQYPSRYTLTWIEPGGVSEEARDLRILKNGLLVPLDADAALGRLADAVDALASRQSRHPLSISVAVETAKRELSGRAVAIGVHDTLRASLAGLNERPEFRLQDRYDSSGLDGFLGRVEEASRLPAALVATLAYWGGPTTDQWWMPELQRFAAPSAGSGVTRLLNLRMVSGSALFYAAGVAAVAADRYDVLRCLLTLQRFNSLRGAYEPLAAALEPARGYEGEREPERRHHTFLSPLLRDALALGEDALDDAWQLFEVLRLALLTRTDARFQSSLDTFTEVDAAFEATKSATNSGDIIAWDRRERALRDAADLVPLRLPHVRVTNQRGPEGFQAPTATHLLAALDAEQSRHPLVSSGIISPIGSFLFALRATNTALGIVGKRHSDAWGTVFRGESPMDLWCDTGEPVTPN